MAVFAQRAWLTDGWCSNVRLSIENGLITRIDKNATPSIDDVRIDTLLPALANLHSHAFQRAMAGMTEFRAADQDSFWTWRSLMYQFLEHLRPEHIEAIAALVFMEMQEAGYASVGEFHYVHHQKNGERYGNPAELTMRILAAASTTGIGLTHLPVLYTYGGAQKTPLVGGQLRFGNSVEQFIELVGSANAAISKLPQDCRVGIAPHSLRATAPEELSAIVGAYPDGPIHIHISEQPKEVEDIANWLGARPVEWLLSNHDVGKNWCLIHATHMTRAETLDLAATQAIVGLCPITEANLGDGPFNGPDYLAANGAFGIGSDSNVRVSLTEELRMLEYSQRLRDLRRNVMVNDAGSVGKTLYLGAASGGALALARDAGVIEIGRLADLLAINTSHQSLCGLKLEQLFDGLCFAAGDDVVSDVWSAGRHMVQHGAHVHRQTITENYKSAIKDLTNRLNA